MEQNLQEKFTEITPTDIPGYTPRISLGQGSFGSVHMCQDKNGQNWAVKVLPISDEERWILRKVKKHPNILKPNHEYAPIGRDRYFLMYKPMIMDIHKYYQMTIFTPVERRQLTVQMLSALQHLHGLLIAHRDIKADNILLGSHRPSTFFLSDFSIAKVYTSMNQMQGKIQFNLGQNDFARDVLQLAAMIWSLSFGIPWKYRIHYMNVEDWANDEQLHKTFEQTTCQLTNTFFKMTLGAKKTHQIKKPHQLLRLYPPSTNQEVDHQKYIHPLKSRSLRSQRVEFRPIPEVQEENSAVENIQEDGIIKETYQDIIQKRIQKFRQNQLPELASKYEKNIQKIQKREKIMKKARNSRHLTLKKKPLTKKCFRCLKTVSFSNWARHKKSCMIKKKNQLKKQRQEQEQEKKNELQQLVKKINKKR